MFTTFKIASAFAMILSAASFASANADSGEFSTRNYCSARSIDRYYCPAFGDLQGPYFDFGCSVTCKSGQRAVCVEATCDGNGQQSQSSCECK